VLVHGNCLNLFNGQLRLTEWSLRALLVLLVVDVFVVAPIAQEETAWRVKKDVREPTAYAAVVGALLIARLIPLLKAQLPATTGRQPPRRSSPSLTPSTWSSGGGGRDMDRASAATRPARRAPAQGEPPVPATAGP
jgi:DMSO/TMAO reductase YedYZ heme-binding membrane subunit